MSIVQGGPLGEEPGLGALTLPGYLREVTGRYAPREALVMHEPDGSVERWSYAELWDRALEVARALIACGVGQGQPRRRPDDQPAGVALGRLRHGAGRWRGVASQHVLHAGGARAPAAGLRRLDPALRAPGPEEGLRRDPDRAGTGDRRSPARASSPRASFPTCDAWPWSGAGARRGDRELVRLPGPRRVGRPRARSRGPSAVKPADPGVLFFSSGSTGKPKGILNAHRGVAIQCWRCGASLALGDDVRCWTANGFFWSGNFAMALGGTLSAGGCLVLQPTFEPARRCA